MSIEVVSAYDTIKNESIIICPVVLRLRQPIFCAILPNGRQQLVRELYLEEDQLQVGGSFGHMSKEQAVEILTSGSTRVGWYGGMVEIEWCSVITMVMELSGGQLAAANKELGESLRASIRKIERLTDELLSEIDSEPSVSKAS